MNNSSSSLRNSLERVFSADGLLSQYVKSYELRKEQQEMSLQVLDAYEKERVLLVEAATGVGKSYAYLVPALLFAAAKREVSIISTHTISLQEQLLKKDIPFLLKVLGLDVQVTLVKGMGNYFCFKKHEEALQEKALLSKQEQKELEILGAFAETSSEGSLSEVGLPLTASILEKVAAERSSCTHSQCPYFKQCFFFKARRKLSESQILIVNHHLLVADLSARLRADFEEEKSILPKCSRVILDEAHHLEEIALESFSAKVSHMDLTQYLGRIYSDLQPHKSRIGLLKAELISKKKMIQGDLLRLIDVEIPVLKRSVTTILDNLFASIEGFCEQELPLEGGSEVRETRWRLFKEHLCVPKWQEQIQQTMLLLQDEVKKYFAALAFLRKEVARITSEEKDLFAPHFTALELLEKVLDQKFSELDLFVLQSFDEKKVRWIERSFLQRNLMLVEARLNVSEYLRKLLFLAKQTVVLCSATLTNNRNFLFLKQQLGLTGEEFLEKTTEKVYDSPFDFQKNALFLVPKDIPFSHEAGFFDFVVTMIKKVICVSKGGCFILFTSYEMLQSCYEKIIRDRKQADLLQFLRQGDASRQTLIERFKQGRNSVLFATSSFWEGVDVAGEKLRCVVLVKLPFRVPTDPLFQAMSEMYEKQGKNAFSDYSLPLACLKFKQGVGRLIRTKEDRGCIVCLDKRVMEKGYGRNFLKNLPKCPIAYRNSQELIQEMEQFYENWSVAESNR